MGNTVLLVLWTIQVIAGGYIGNARGRMTAGILLSMVLGVIGWLIVLCIPRTHENLVQRERNRLQVQADAYRQGPYGLTPGRGYVPEYQPPDTDEAADSLLERGEWP